MKLRSIAAVLLVIAAQCSVLRAQATASKTGEIHMLCSNGVKAVIEQITPQLQQSIGSRFSIEFGTAASLKQKIDAGAPFDVAILTPGMIATLTTQGKIVQGTGADVSRTDIGVAVRAGAPKSDVSSPEKLKQTLLNAKSITYFKSGSIADVITELIERLGISAELKPKLNPQLQASHAAEAVAAGEVEVAITLIREIQSVRGVEYLGPVPPDLPSSVILTAGVGAKSNDVESAKAVVKFLTGPSAEPTLRANGMEPARRK